MPSVIQTVDVHHDLLDYLAALGGAVGGAAAVIALALAVMAKKDAKRSAGAAEATQRLADQQVAIMRQEAAAAQAERERRAAPTIHLGVGNRWPRLIVLTVGFSNEQGTRAIDRLPVNLQVPDSIDLYTCADLYGNDRERDYISHYPSVRLGDHVGANVWAPVIGPIEPLESAVRYLTLLDTPPGVHRIEAIMVHRDLPSGRSKSAWNLTVPEGGAGVELEAAIPDAQ